MKTKTLLQIPSTNSEYRILRIIPSGSLWDYKQIKKFLLLNSSILLFFCSFVLLSLPAVAQAPQAFKYQTVVRNSSNLIISNQAVGLKISILQGSASGTPVYIETHSTTTNILGIANLEIGNGTLVSGNFSTISWGTNSYFVKIELDPTGGTAYQLMGTSQLLSVPYALYAASGNQGPQGPAGPTGATGATGATGPQGPAGPTGATGPQGSAGADGKTVLNGTTNPTAGTGVNGDFYINTSTNMIFGPKAGGVWPTGVNLVGPTGATGATGPTGANGKAVLNGTINPTGTVGVDGDFYINTVTNMIFGPKTAGTWPAGVSLVGPQGPAGTAAPGGSSGHVQFNNSGLFGGSSNLFWDNTNNRLGIRNNTPQATLDIYGYSPQNGMNVINDYGNSGTSALRVVGAFDAKGFLGTQGGNSFDGITGLDLLNEEIGVLGTSTGSSVSDNYGVKGYSNNIGVQGNHATHGTFGMLGTTVAGAEGYSTADRYGQLGTSQYGVYAKYDANRFGYIGSSFYGAYAQYNSDNNGILGGSNFGVYGKNTSERIGHLATNTAGASGINYGTSSGMLGVVGVAYSQANGTGYYYTNTQIGILGNTFYGNNYRAGLQGVTYQTDIGNRTSGVIGIFADWTSTWGSLAYQNSGNNNYAAYFTAAAATGAGKISGSQPVTDIGLGVWGDLLGADIHGNVYGMYLEGSRYSLFADGIVLKTDLDVHLQRNNNSAIKGEQIIPLFTNVSTEVTVQTSGIGQLNNGLCTVQFSPEFRNSQSNEYPVIITVTPMGESNGIYIVNVNNNGFSIKENNNGNSNVQFTYIAIARRSGYEVPELPAEAVATSYKEILKRGLHNDSDLDSAGEGLYFQNGELINGQAGNMIPQNLPKVPMHEIDNSFEDIHKSNK